MADENQDQPAFAEERRLNARLSTGVYRDHIESRSNSSFDGVRRKVASLLFNRMGIPEEKSLRDIPLKDLCPDFDSLSLLEIQLLLEKEYEFEFPIDSPPPKALLRSTTRELVNMVLAAAPNRVDRDISAAAGSVLPNRLFKAD